MNRKKRILLAVGAILAFVMVIVLGCIAAEWYEESRKGIAAEEEKDVEEEYVAEEGQSRMPEEAEGTDTWVIFGVDSRSGRLGEGTRSDSIIIVTLDHETKNVRMASVYRDCMVHIEGHGYEKITHAHSYGGPELAVQTINENFDLDVEYYVSVNFEGAAKLVDEMGGVDIEITDEEAEILGADYPRISGAGVYTLTGDEAVAYSRIRHAEGGDYKRAERQRTVLSALFAKAKEMETTKLLQIMNDLFDEIDTNCNSGKAAELLYNLSRYSVRDAAAFPQVFYGGMAEGAWVEVPVTLTDMVESMHEFLYEEREYEPSDRVKEYSEVLNTKASVANTDLRE